MSDHKTNIVIVGLIVRDGKILVAKRADTKTIFPGEFELIGGHLDPGEQPKEALKREIREEIEVDVRVGDPVAAFTYTDSEGFKIEVAYICELYGEQEPVAHPQDHSELRWITQDDIAMLGKDDEETEILKKAFVMRGGKNE